LPGHQFLPLLRGGSDDVHARRRLVERLRIHALIVAGDAGSGLSHAIPIFDHLRAGAECHLAATRKRADHVHLLDPDDTADLRVEQIVHVDLPIEHFAHRAVREIQRVIAFPLDRGLVHLNVARHIVDRHAHQLVGDRNRRPCRIRVILDLLVAQDRALASAEQHLVPLEDAFALAVALDVAFIDPDHPREIVLIPRLLVFMVEPLVALLVIGAPGRQILRLLRINAHADQVGKGDLLGMAEERRLAEACKPLLVQELFGSDDMHPVALDLLRREREAEQPGRFILSDRPCRLPSVAQQPGQFGFAQPS
jgi:hypothetical protein